MSAITLLLESDVEEVVGRNVSHSDVRRFIFDRLNTGGRPLNAQELRNAIFPGKLNDAIIRATRNQLFTKIWGIPPYTEADPNDYYENPRRQKNRLYATMSDCEIVLRYFALRNDQYIRGSMRGILDDCMRRSSQNPLDEGMDLSDHYVSRLEVADQMFEGRPFEIPAGRIRKKSIALQDAVMVACDRLWRNRQRLIAAGPTISGHLDELALNDETAPILTGQGNTAQAIRERLRMVQSVFQSALRT